jgi:cell wall assembly regulator SMI1
VTSEKIAQQTWTKLERRLQTAEPGLLKLLPRGATPGELATAERAVGALPALVRAIYRVHNGIGMPATGGHGDQRYAQASYFLSLSDMVSAWQDLNEVLNLRAFDDARVCVEGSLRSRWWHPRWIPITATGGGDCYCLDLDPAAGGTVGQIVNFGHDSPERAVHSPDLARFLLEHVEEYEWAAVWRQSLNQN